MSSSITFVYNKKELTTETKNSLIEYAKSKDMGIHFGLVTAINEDIINSLSTDQDFFILSDKQFHDTVEDLLSIDLQLSKDQLIKHHSFLDDFKNTMIDNGVETLWIYVSFSVAVNLFEYETEYNVNNISEYLVAYMFKHYMIPDPTKFVYTKELQ
ncbi:hypothetical protein JV173_01870 [Acholeplasma equirhinis]|uniref:hypothetical protein n=1 Tax=Acholeplasma equirhinis TaxID=555393 RepID=UPI00197AC634|nr:hypothetical protein [Acholeplasma equirhinis]MBN3490252.1 hypothetical protein [Acholeplasma equirhinis]